MACPNAGPAFIPEEAAGKVPAPNPLEAAFLAADTARTVEEELLGMKQAWREDPEIAALIEERDRIQAELDAREAAWENQDHILTAREEIALQREIHDKIARYVLDHSLPRVQGLYRLKVTEERVVDPARFRAAYPAIFEAIATVSTKAAEDAIGTDALEPFITRKTKGTPKIEYVSPRTQKKRR